LFCIAGWFDLASHLREIARKLNQHSIVSGYPHLVLSNALGFVVVAFLGSVLAQSLRKKGIELEEKREELLDLQDFTEDIIHSMRGGLLTTDVDGGITLLNRTGEEILGRRFAEVRGLKLQDWNEDFWLPGQMNGLEKSGQRREIEFQTPDGHQRYIGISVSPLRSRDLKRSGYVFNFQDLTELRRLEQEVATKERMAALGRLSAAIAHEIRQPLTAMAGAVGELGRMVPMEEDEKHLVNIVSRESERLNQIITDFLNYSREKTYEFKEADVRSLLEETLTLLEKKPEVGNKYLIERTYNGRKSRRAWMREESGRCSGIYATTRCAPCPMAEGLPSALTSGRFGCAWRFAIRALDSMRNRRQRSLSRCNPI